MTTARQMPFAALDEIGPAARAALDDGAWAYLESGAGRGQTLDENRAAFDKWHLLPSPLSGIEAVRTQTTFLGLQLGSPLLTGPVGTYSVFHQDGDLAVARAAQRFGTAAIVPVLSSYTLEQTAAAAPASAKVFQVLASGPADRCLSLAARAQDAGYSVLCITIDAYPVAARDRVVSAGFAAPIAVAGANYGSDAELELTRHIELGAGAWSWKTLHEMIEQIELPVLVKGVLTRATAEAAVDAGARGIMVSNVGGRQVDGAPSSLQQLPEIVEAVGDDVEIAFDSGVRRGTDALKALALGADVVSLGRIVAMGLAAGGEDGVLATLELLHDELVRSMAISGVADVADLGPSILKARAR